MSSITKKKLSMREIVAGMKQTEKESGVIPTYIGEFYDKETDTVLDFDKDIAPSGFKRSNIHVILGKTGNGKTERAIQCAVSQAMNGFRVCYITLEQTPEEMAAKMLAKTDDSLAHKWESMGEKEKEAFELQKAQGLRLVSGYFENEKGESMMDIIYGSFTCKEMTKYLKEDILTDRYDIIYVDNFQNCGRTQIGYQEYEDLTSDTMSMVKETNKALVWLSQMDEKTGRTKNTRTLEQDMTLGLKIYKEIPKEPWDKKKDDGELPSVKSAPVSYMDVHKNRKHPRTPLEIAFPFDMEKGRIGTFIKETLEDRLKAKGLTMELAGVHTYKKELEKIEEDTYEKERLKAIEEVAIRNKEKEEQKQQEDKAFARNFQEDFKQYIEGTIED